MPLPKIQRKNTDPMIHNIFHKYFMNPFTILKPVWRKKKTVSPILVPACQHITGDWVSHVTSGLHYCVGQARCTEIRGRTERRTEGKVKGRWKGEWREGGGEGGGRGCYHIIAPCLYIFPLIIFGPHSLQSLNHTSPEDSEGTWEGLRFMADSARQASESYTDRCQCVWKYGDFGGARRDKRERKRSCGRITAEFAHCQTKPVLQA